MSADHPGVHRLGQRSAGHAPVRTRQEKAEKPAARGPRRCNRGDTRDHGAHGRVNGGSKPRWTSRRLISSIVSIAETASVADPMAWGANRSCSVAIIKP